MSRPPGHPIVVGYADDRSSRRAVVVAAELARELQATLIVAHVIELDDYPVDPDQVDYDVAADRALDQLHRVAAHLEDTGIDWMYTVDRGDPAAVLVRIAEHTGARLIVVSARAATGPAGRVEHLIQATPSVVHRLELERVPVLVVPAGNADRE